jgi:dipeptidyl aminopeptidase/acylaminoacyl peptidase
VPAAITSASRSKNLKNVNILKSDSSAHTDENDKDHMMDQDQLSPLIPRQTLFGNPDKASVQLSPDGTRIAYLAPVDGVLNVWVGPAGDPAAATPVTRDRSRGVRFYCWAYTNRHILYLQDQGGDENWRLYSVALDSSATQDLTPIEGIQARLQEISAKVPQEILIALNDRVPELHDIYRLNLDTGERCLIQQNPGFTGFVSDDEYNIRFAVRMTADGGSEILTPQAEGSWQSFIRIAMEDTLTTAPLGFDKTGTRLFMHDSRNRNTAALTVLDVSSGEPTVLAEDPQADVSDHLVHPSEKHVQAVAFTHTRKRWHILDTTLTADMAYLRTVADGDIEVVSRTLDDRHWIIAYIMDSGPVRYYRYSCEPRQVQFLFTNRQALDGLPLATMHPVVISSRDGLSLVSYYTLPVGSARHDNARPQAPLPTVLLVHGGPWARDVWGFDPWHQWLANRGYAVLSVNFRGSTGMGKAFINAANQEWGAKMHDDLLDAVAWATQAGIADPARVAIMGGSYGGYATLVGLTLTPDTFACGIDIVGPSNLVTLLESIPPYWQPQVELFATRVGDHRTEAGRTFLTARSPLTHIDRLQRPLLIAQGANDPRVRQAESDQIVQAMQAKGIPVTYVLYPDEGHGFARPANQLSCNAITEAFLATYLGGRYEPIGGAFVGSSLTVPTGAQLVPGLAEALGTR